MSTNIAGDILSQQETQAHTFYILIFYFTQNCDLSGCDLQEANLRGSNVKGAIFEEMLTPLHMSQSVR